MGFGKSAPAAEPPPFVPEGDGDATAEEMEMNLMRAMMMMSSIGGGGGAPAVPQAPQVIQAPEIDWTDKSKKIASKMKAEFHTDQLQKHGLADTVHTSPLLTEPEEPTGSILTGSVE